MRKYPPAGNIMRICTKKYVIPGTDVKIDEGTPIMIPGFSLQNDPQYFPEPENFDPERFSEPNALHNYQYVHMPFGDGPRQCIGNIDSIIYFRVNDLKIFLCCRQQIRSDSDENGARRDFEQIRHVCKRANQISTCI
jgi:Cytochrome P450